MDEKRQQVNELWLLAIVYPLLAFTSNSIWTSTTSITDPINDFYHITNSVVGELPNLTFSAVFILIAPAVPWITTRFTIYRILLCAAILMSLGSLCRALSFLSFFWLLLGNVLVAVAQPLVSTNLSSVAIQCVGDARQGTYIGVVGVVGSIGTAWGFAVSSWLIQTADDFQYYFPRIELLYLAMNLSCVAGLFCVCQSRSIDDTPTNGNAPFTRFPLEHKAKIGIAIVVVCILAAASNAITIVLEQILLDQGYGAHEVLVSGLLYLVPCIFFPLAFGMLVDQTQHDTLLSVLVYGITCILQVLVLYSGLSLQWFYVTITLYGITTNVLSTILLPTTNRWANSRHPNTINMIYSWLNTVLTLVLTIIFTALPTQTSTDIFVLLAALCLLGSLSLWLFSTPDTE